jgi:protoheme IX farnesyltransferase
MIARLQLAKVPLCLLIGCAALFGAVLAEPVLSLPLLLVAGGVFIVATGAASLNSLQEQELDGKMARTRNRPLPAGLLTPVQAGGQAVFLLLFGLLVIAAGAKELLPAAVTFGAVVLYNGVYTPLKQKSVMAIVPGALCGALPACIGWLAGGGGATATAILIVALFVLWQIPHFWLVILSNRQDYADSRLPNLLNQFDERIMRRLLITWIGALSSVMLLFGALPYPLSIGIRCGVVANGLILPAVFFYWLARNPPNYRFLFMALNCALLLHMVLLSAGRIAGG